MAFFSPIRLSVNWRWISGANEPFFLSFFFKFYWSFGLIERKEGNNSKGRDRRGVRIEEFHDRFDSTRDETGGRISKGTLLSRVTIDGYGKLGVLIRTTL